MNFFEWKDEYCVNIESIDSQHKKLVLMIESLYVAMMGKQTHQKLTGIVNDMVDYSVYHFETEEQLMDQYEYSEIKKHMNEHIFFKKKAYEFKEQLEHRNMFLTPEIMNFLKDWLINHILNTDRKLAFFLIQKGQK